MLHNRTCWLPGLAALAAALFLAAGLRADEVWFVEFDAAQKEALRQGKDLLIDPLIDHMIGSNLTSQPSAAELKNPYTPSDAATEGPTRPDLYALIDTLNQCGGSACPNSRTKLIAKATCGAVLGSGAVLID